MVKILILGAGRSTWFLIEYLIRGKQKNHWELTVADRDAGRLKRFPARWQIARKITLDIESEVQRRREISAHDIVISMLPPAYHSMVARDCLDYEKHFLSTSYIPGEIQEMDRAAKKKKLLFLNGCGLDPGIDHMSGVYVLDGLKQRGAEIKGFCSYTGGLVAPYSDDNPWNYKISWNPMNVVKAGQGTARYLKEGKIKLIPYSKLFKRTTPLNIPGYGDFEGYFNRDSLRFHRLYDLRDINTMVRGTLRRRGFCEAWDVLVQLGMTSDYPVLSLEGMKWREFTDIFLPLGDRPVDRKLSEYLQSSLNEDIMQKLRYLGLFDHALLPLEKGTPAQVLKDQLIRKLSMKQKDQDLVVMVHYITYRENGSDYLHKSYLTLEGKNKQETAIAKTVGTPLAIVARLLMEKELKTTGVNIPVKPGIYRPVLEELRKEGIRFDEVIQKDTAQIH